MYNSDNSVDILGVVLLDQYTNSTIQYFESKIFDNMGFHNIANNFNVFSNVSHMNSGSIAERALSLGFDFSEFSYSGNLFSINTKQEQNLALQALLNDAADTSNESVALLIKSIAELEQNNDYVSSNLLKDVLSYETSHLNWLNQQISMIDVLGLSDYLVKNG